MQPTPAFRHGAVVVSAGGSLVEGDTFTSTLWGVFFLCLSPALSLSLSPFHLRSRYRYVLPPGSESEGPVIWIYWSPLTRVQGET